MRKSSILAALGAAAFSLSACGGGEAGGNGSTEVEPGQSVNAADGINTGADASGTTGSSTGDSGGPLNIAGDAEADANEANQAASNAQ